MSETTRRCPKCAQWHLKSEKVCPNCGTVKPGFNKSLRMSALNANLYQQAERA